MLDGVADTAFDGVVDHLVDPVPHLWIVAVTYGVQEQPSQLGPAECFA